MSLPHGFSRGLQTLRPGKAISTCGAMIKIILSSSRFMHNVILLPGCAVLRAAMQPISRTASPKTKQNSRLMA